jgi:Pyruvate/2-oxoacid:ferredoxin oxidoreductase delta subunit
MWRAIFGCSVPRPSFPASSSSSYPLQRVISVDEAIEAKDQIHTYDQVKTYIEENDQVAVATCYCRHAASLRGEDTHGMPMQACFSFGQTAEFAVECLGARKLTKQEANALLDECEEAGLVHMTHNVTDGVSYLCNCDKWHCFAVQIALKQPKPSAVFNSGFEPRFDPDSCTACEICIDRCPANALAMGEDDVPDVDLDRCFGCAVCATGCPDEGVKMVAKAGAEAPPKDNDALMQAMFASFSK